MHCKILHTDDYGGAQRTKGHVQVFASLHNKRGVQVVLNIEYRPQGSGQVGRIKLIMISRRYLYGNQHDKQLKHITFLLANAVQGLGIQ